MKLYPCTCIEPLSDFTSLRSFERPQQASSVVACSYASLMCMLGIRYDLDGVDGLQQLAQREAQGQGGFYDPFSEMFGGFFGGGGGGR